MPIFNRRIFSFAAALLLTVGLAACGDPEPEQRKAFIAFLQTMIDRPGVHVMNVKPDDEKTFGEYTKHYAVILNFNTGMRTVMEEFANRLKQMGLDQASPRTIEQMVTHRADIFVVSEGLEKSKAGMEAQLAAAQAERAALKQPDDLKKVYDAAFKKIIVVPVKGVENTYAGLAGAVKASLQLVDYIIAHPSKLTVSGSQVRASDARTLDELNALLKAHNAAGTTFNEARTNLRKIMEGG
jgi:hypothetical protein